MIFDHAEKWKWQFVDAFVDESMPL